MNAGAGRTIREAASRLAGEARDLRDALGGPAVWTRLSVAVSPADPSAWLRAQESPVRLYWSGRDERRMMAGIGCAAVIGGEADPTPAGMLRRCLAVLPDHPDARAYGGFAFHPRAAGEEAWRDFGPARFWIPGVELVRDDNGSRLACTLPPDAAGRDAVLRDLACIAEPMATPAAPPLIVARENLPGRADWEEMVRAALDLIAAEALEKIVLARKADHRFAAALDPAVLLGRLRAVTSNCYHFLFQPAPGAAFLGTSPERLFRRDGRALFSEALAGTRVRSPDPDEDLRLARELLASAKDQREHDIVRRSLRQRLHLLCSTLEVAGQASLLRLERKQHLHSRVAGTLLPGVTDAELLAALHPTPAVGGYPSDVAVHEILRLEPFQRGWYAGPVGWVSRDAAEFAVAIRSGLARGDTMSVYSGAGIVNGSVPGEEWDEIEAKIGDFQKVAQPA